LFWRKKKEEPRGEMPPDQTPTPGILRWGIDHSGITHVLPVVSKEEWLLTVDGEVDSPLAFKWVDFLALPQVESVSDFHCVEGWSVLKQRWGGVLFKTIQERAQPRKGVEFVWFECADGYTTSLPLSELQGDDAILAHTLNSKDLTQPLGGPMRLVVPQKYAYKSPMWLTKITFATREKLGFWERGYYSNTADIWKNDRYRLDA
jgi:DMSO/TMAO reductase YedYZ molybdopterin-dependent catalytic subunit